MTQGPQGCGVIQHPEECLCDVPINPDTTTQYVIIPYQIPAGVALAHYGKWDGTLLHWFELMDFAWSAIKSHRKQQAVVDNRDRYGRGLPADVYYFMKRRIREGAGPTQLRNEIQEQFDVTISVSYVSHLKKRMAKRGEL